MVGGGADPTQSFILDIFLWVGGGGGGGGGGGDKFMDYSF